MLKVLTCEKCLKLERLEKIRALGEKMQPKNRIIALGIIFRH